VKGLLAHGEQEVLPERVLPPGALLVLGFHPGEGAVDHFQAVAAFHREAHRLARQLIDAFQLVVAQRHRGGFAVLVHAVAVVDHHRHRQPLHLAALVLNVGDVAVHLVIDHIFVVEARN